MKTALKLVFFGLLLIPMAAQAEYTRIDLTIFGMDWAICAHAVSVALKKMDGVESVEVSLNDGKAVIRLKPGNAVTLAQVRKAVTEKGFTPKEARIEAAGDLTASKEELRFEVAAVGEGFSVEPATHKEWRAKAGRNLRITGIVAAPSSEKAVSRVQLLTVSSQPPKQE